MEAVISAQLKDINTNYRMLVFILEKPEQQHGIEVETNPFDGAEVKHPIRNRRASIITGEYRGGVFCRLENNLDCLCTYSPHQYDENFHIGD